MWGVRLSLWESWRAKARLRGQARRERTAHAAISRLFVRAMLSPRPRITVSILALSVIAARCQLPQRGSHWHVGQVYAGRAKYDVPETVVLRCLGQQQLDKVRLSRSRCPRKQGPPFCAISGLGRPDES